MAIKGITEVDFKPLLTQQIPTHQGAAPHCADLLTALLPEALPCWTRISFASLQILLCRFCLCKTLMASLPLVLSSRPAD